MFSQILEGFNFMLSLIRMHYRYCTYVGRWEEQPPIWGEKFTHFNLLAQKIDLKTNLVIYL